MLDLGEESLAAEHGAELRLEHFDGDVAVVLHVVREVDGRHAAGAELSLDAIAVGERDREVSDTHLIVALAASIIPLRTSTRSNAPGTSSTTMIRPSAVTSNDAADPSDDTLGATSASISRVPVTDSAGFDVIDATISLPRWSQ